MKKNDISTKLETIVRYSKTKYIFEKVVLQRFFVISIIIVLINWMFEYKTINYLEFLSSSVIKVLIILVVGIISGKLEWNIYQLLLLKKERHLKEIRLKYIMNFGIFSWAIPIAILKINISMSSLLLSGVEIIIWVVFGVFFGMSMWNSVSSEYEEYIKVL